MNCQKMKLRKQFCLQFHEKKNTWEKSNQGGETPVLGNYKTLKKATERDTGFMKRKN